MLLALLLLATDAHLAVPKDLQEKREHQKDPQSAWPLFSNPALLEALGEMQNTPGAWAEYVLSNRKNTPVIRVRLSLLNEAAPQGKYWLELDTVASGTIPEAMKLLLHGPPSKPSNIDKLVLYMMGQAPLEIPVSQMQDQLKDAPAKAPPPVRHGKSARVKVRAGELSAETLTVGDTKLWRSSEVPLWGLVKATSPRESIELMGFGKSGARSVFPELDQGNGSESTK